MIADALKDILHCGGLAAGDADRVRFTGADPVLPTPFHVGTAGAATLGAVGLAMAKLREYQTGRHPDVEIDVRRAAASLRSGRYVLVNGKPGRDPSNPLSGFYPVAGGRWIYFHSNLRPHREALLRVLGVPAERSRVAEAASRWLALDLEQAVDVAGGCAPAVRTPAEWRALPNTATLVTEPLVEIRKIADCAPIALPGADRPLNGIRALDLTRVTAGPTCGRLLAEYGADVLKITCERHPDSYSSETDTLFGKHKATLDIATPAGRDRFTALLRDCDVFCQAYRRDAMTGLGFSPEQVAMLRPGIVYTSLSAFGFTGVWRGRRGFDTVVQAASGMAYVSGRGREPKLTPASALDYLAGYLMTFGTLLALVRRAEEGGSYCVNVSLARTSEWLTAMGTFDPGVVDATPAEFTADELANWMVEVPTPLGQVRRMSPVIGFSDGLLQDLPVWRDSGNPGPVWAN